MEDLAEKCMAADNTIWGELGIMCGYSSDPNTKTTANSWDEYVAEVKAWIDSNGVREWSASDISNVYKTLEAENYHSFRQAMMEVL